MPYFNTIIAMHDGIELRTYRSLITGLVVHLWIISIQLMTHMFSINFARVEGHR